ncbi:MAG: FAD-dependent oxidoreductase [Gammaproteobacteria bacterium]|nr:FAD-dependent oxidoreductase [Gammaproteobacteria bacterium]
MHKPSAANTFDVIVVGGGGAGLSAAIEAAELGRSVLLVEKESQLGGSTAWSVGSISVTNSEHQRRAGIADTPEAHFEDLEALSGSYANRDNRVLRRVLVDNITQTFQWLQDRGLVFVGPMPEPPHRYPRMHNVLPNSRAFRDRLGSWARRVGVELRTDSLVTDILFEGAEVCGIEITPKVGATYQAHARGGVVLAGGDYSANPQLKRRYASEDAARLSPVNPAATGEGIVLGQRAGGDIVNGDVVRGPVIRFVPPPKSWTDSIPSHPSVTKLMRLVFERVPSKFVRPFMMKFLTTALGLSGELLRAGAILVNREGVRYCDELDDPNPRTAAQTDGLAWVVFDSRIGEAFQCWPNFVSTAPGVAYAYLSDYQRTRPDVFYQADSLATLAGKVGWAPGSLEETVSRFNESDSPHRLTQAPFYALGPVKAYVVFTDGGLNVNEHLEVLTADGAAIPKLYAAGSNGQGGVMLEGHGHHLGWAFVSGRLAGRHAAFNVASEPSEHA